MSVTRVEKDVDSLSLTLVADVEAADATQQVRRRHAHGLRFAFDSREHMERLERAGSEVHGRR